MGDLVKKPRYTVINGRDIFVDKHRRKKMMQHHKPDLHMKLKEIIFVVEEDPEGGYTAQAMGSSIYTEGEDLEELKRNVKDALKCHFNKIEMPLYIRFHIVKEEKFAYA